MKLHIGCGSKVLDGFVNVDIRPLDGIDVVSDASLDGLDNDSVDLIYACHILEHICRHGRLDIMKRWIALLKPGGVLRLAVPDFEKIVQLYTSGLELENLIGMLYGGQDYSENFHYYTWDLQSITRDLEFVGFREVNRYDWRSTEHAEVDDYSQSYWPHMEKETGLLVSLNVEARKEKS